jgi:hypothetical protein
MAARCPGSPRDPGRPKLQFRDYRWVFGRLHPHNLLGPASPFASLHWPASQLKIEAIPTPALFRAPHAHRVTCQLGRTQPLDERSTRRGPALSISNQDCARPIMKWFSERNVLGKHAFPLFRKPFGARPSELPRASSCRLARVLMGTVDPSTHGGVRACADDDDEDIAPVRATTTTRRDDEPPKPDEAPGRRSRRVPLGRPALQL